MKRIILLLSLCLFLFNPATLASPQQGWIFDSSDNGITIHYREHTDGLVEIRAQMFFPTSYAAFLKLLEDTDNVPNWIDNVAHSHVVQQLSPRENIVYTQFAAPWPAQNRDMLTYSKYSLDEAGFTLQISDAPETAFPRHPGYIRITQVKASWVLNKLTNDTTHIEYTAFANPGGALPDWLVNKLAKESARATFEGLREQLPRFQHLRHPHISE
ncbi:START domain-containing protein [Vibrio vulnificus]|uniref:START domain-containing protein n=1 Tax=Vibrio vulnificus TaxID=672 RepID=UPI001CDD21A9|nr:START domain-containing protein [Vibrio vulnificus]MCA3882138.1 START domain-containing protein [Vibrio vulnificus]MCA3948410.1 START domain-containing protein [Vibrio vulnificus]